MIPRSSSKERRYYRISLTMVSLLRVLLGGIVPLQAGYATRWTLDDYLMIQYAQLHDHFHPASVYDMNWALTKTMSYPYFLSGLMMTGIPYTLALSVLWVVGALVTTIAMKQIWNHAHDHDVHWFIWFLIYTFLLFSPVAFDAKSGTRIYRESILPPTVLILVGLFGMWVLAAVDRYFRRPKALSRQLAWGAVLGTVWSFFWFVKESSIWLAPTFIGTSLIVLAAGIPGIARCVERRRMKSLIIQIVSTLAALAVPLTLFAGGNAVYRAINQHYYGVPYASVRTEGEIAGFFERLYRIDDPNKTDEYWVPWTTIEMAVAASPTLQSQPRLIHQMKVGAFVDGEWGQGPNYDMGVWALMADLSAVGMFDNQV